MRRSCRRPSAPLRTALWMTWMTLARLLARVGKRVRMGLPTAPAQGASQGPACGRAAAPALLTMMKMMMMSRRSKTMRMKTAKPRLLVSDLASAVPTLASTATRTEMATAAQTLPATGALALASEAEAPLAPALALAVRCLHPASGRCWARR